MSNASLKEQLQALSLVSTEGSTDQRNSGQVHNHNNKEKKPKKRHQPEKNAGVKQKPAWLEYAQYGVELLKAHFPKCFRDIKEIQPLKKGIKQDLVKDLSTKESIVIGDKACMVSSLSYYVNSIAYHKSVSEGAVRIDLEGNPAGVVTADESQYSIECRKTKLLKKKNQSPSTQSAQPTTAEIG